MAPIRPVTATDVIEPAIARDPLLEQCAAAAAKNLLSTGLCHRSDH